MRISKSTSLILFVHLSFVLLFTISNSWSESFLKSTQSNELTPVSVFAQAYADSQSNIQVTQKGIITRVLADDTVGDRHQRLIVRLSNNQTLLIAHNIDLSPRVPNPVVGKNLGFFGEYEWNKDGGVIHWTHKDPDCKHVTGWLEYEGKLYSSYDSAVAVIDYNTINQTYNRNFVTSSDNNSISFTNITNINMFFDLQGRSLPANFITSYSGYNVIPGNHSGRILIHSKLSNLQF